VDPDKDLVVFGDRLRDLSKPLDLWRPIPDIDYRSHGPLSLASLGCE
jgi:hypothetical protein